MANMFFGATAFNQAIGTWTTAAVTTMAGMFYGAAAFNQAIGTWNTALVSDMRYMWVSTSTARRSRSDSLAL